MIGTDEDGQAVYGPDPGHVYTASPGVTTELYGYDALDRLQSVLRDGVQVDLRYYDGSSDVVETGPGTNLPTGYAAALNANVANDAVIGDAVRVNPLRRARPAPEAVRLQERQPHRIEVRHLVRLRRCRQRAELPARQP